MNRANEAGGNGARPTRTHHEPPYTEQQSERDADRAELARRQTELLAALVAGGPAPEGFDIERLRIQTTSLAAKRRDGVARAFPDLPADLGDRWPRAFMQWARTHPKPATGGSRADGLVFIEFLREQGQLPDPAATADDALSNTDSGKPGFFARWRKRRTRENALWDSEDA